MNYASIRKIDIANGIGVRVSLFVSGCTRHCKDCFNPETWDFNYGSLFTDETKQQILELLKPSYIHGLTVLGGEPFEPFNQSTVLDLMHTVKQTTNKTIWCYTGYTYEQLDSKFLHDIDVLVDGPFLLEYKKVNLRFRGSINQRIIDVQESLRYNDVILWNG